MKKLPAGGPSAKGGFTLLETLFAMMVILLGFMAALSMNTTALRSGTLNETQFQAVFLADSKLEEYKSYIPDFAGSVLEEVDYFDRSGLPAETQDKAFFTRRASVTLEKPSAKTDEVRVTVTSKLSRTVISYVVLLDHSES
ncbi:MAG: prepilin-type N-terminal cleavage/methylation domain-containing protein [Deltaproteobacteria bacterium]|jgi:prepilin-type N-terminal cleavage/methylation domain-containing protein|nr:prepilin-type N-terminal cleavage/methylation domain-containing protein [Deltaproteobacteria bacterium]